MRALVHRALVFLCVTIPALSPVAAATDAEDEPAVEAEATTADDEPDEETWDVADPPGEEREVTIDVTEGTWMNLDVSPDGREIVFDLLGDLYVLPIEGGEAAALTSGMAWDMQPRFAPDGGSIAYTSDAGGGDNLWILDRASGERTQVTEEDFRLLNNPAWSPDGEYLAARKHFTSNRSLGAGEIWLYHRSGGGGLQMTEKPNEQKDVGEPAFSPDGRYLYYSHDATPGPTFEYNKNPHVGIYQIARLDRETGTVEPFVVRAGGAVRPTPSPDGAALAFVGRAHGYGTALLVQDVASGAIRVLHEGLDRDHQETWAIHGLYANFAWTPDSRSIVLWSGGRLHRIDVAGGEVVEIPFHVRQTHRVGATVDSAREPPATFETRMLRWVEVSPSGDRVLFQALGRIWLQDLPAGEPRRLTTQREHWELYPSFSRDGRSVVYVSWDDEELGAVRIAPAGGPAEGRVVTPVPGHYVEPALSPSGTTVVYRKVAGGLLSRDLYGRDLGLYRVAVTGGEASRISERGVLPHFGADSSRVFFMTFEEENKRALRSVGLSGSPAELAEREHFTGEAALEWRVSPDGRWVAFTERFKAFVAPFAVTGRAVAIGADTESFPVEQVSAEAGEYLHWSGDGARLHWTLGNTLYTRPLDDAFAFLGAEAATGAAEEEAEPAITETGLGMTVDKGVPSGIVALVGGRVITVDADDRVIDDATVVVEGDRIVAVGPSTEVEVPAGAHVVDAAGKTVMPGFIDVHWHGVQGFDEIVPEQNWFHFAALAFGVTTIHDPSTDTSTFFAAAEMERAGLITAPRLFSTGTILYGAAGPALRAEIDSLEDARFHLARMKAAGAFSVKSYNQPRRDQRQQVLAAARELGMLVVPEGGSLYEHDMTMVVDGHTGIEHAVPVEHLYQDVLQLWSQTGSAYTPTLVVAYGGIWGENYWYAKTDVWNHERLLTFVPREQVDPLARRPFQAPDEEYNHIRIAEGAVALAERGVRVNVGAHGQREGLGAHWEIWMLVQGGMSEMQALRAATWNGARYLGMHGHLGSLEPGKLADLIVLDRDPLEDIRNTESVSLTMVGGRLYDAATMNEVGNHPRQRAPMFWE